jgi:hypothetical protein
LTQGSTLNGNYISKQQAAILTDAGFKVEPCHDLVSSGIGNRDISVRAEGIILMRMLYLNEVTNKKDFIDFSCKIIDSKIPLIIGLPTIRAERLTERIKSFFELPSCGIVLVDSDMEGTFSKIKRPGKHKASMSPGKNGGLICNMENLTEVCATIANMDSLENDPYQFGIDDGLEPWEVKKAMDAQTGELDTGLPEISGSNYMRRRLRQICKKYKEIFSDSLNEEPAKIDPMHLEVDKASWERNCNRQPPRRMSTERQAEMIAQIKEMLNIKVIKPSQANHYSQVLMVPKPHGGWRFCIDFRLLNEATKPMGWTIPNIKEMLERIGSHRPKFFGILDFLKGYYQAPLDEDSREFTAFKCFSGTYEWLRVPMGLKGAPSYFQQQMAQKALGGLLYNGVELYIDDILVYAETEKDFLEKIEVLFQRLKEKGITISPKKCKLGLDRIEYVGHVIDSEGMSFSDSKIRRVVDFAVPTSFNTLRSFLGFINYFRNNIPKLSILEEPLARVLNCRDQKKKSKSKTQTTDSNKGRKFVWTSEAQHAFEKIRDVCNRMPRLFFRDPTLPIFVETDASDFAYGSYTYQKRLGTDGIWRDEPLAFLSQTFNKTQLNWSTIEKECFAIIFTLKKLDYLLRDSPFTLRTDHANHILMRRMHHLKY